jgi:epoxide hydrolase-like predicted phosphatase
MTLVPSTTRAVVFDYGGVLINPITDQIGRLADRHGVSMEDLLHVLMGPREVSTSDHPWHRAERGEMAVADMPANVGPWAAEKGITLDGDEFDAVLHGTFVVRARVVEIVRALRAAGYITGLLTNSFREFRPVIEAAVDVRLFDHVVDSSEVRCRKPEPEIYAVTLARLGVMADEVLYIDDFLANVEGARRAGWRAVHVRSEDDVLAAVAALLPAATTSPDRH